MPERTFTVDDILSFERRDNGDVWARINGPNGVRTTVPINDGIWVSLILTMTAFNERSNDWPAFIAHHQGTVDLLKSEKTLSTIRNLIKHSE